MSPTESLTKELAEINAEAKALRATLLLRRTAWANEKNAKANIPPKGLDAGMWGKVSAFEPMHCLERFPEEDSLLEVHERKAEILEQLKYQPQIDALAAVVAKLTSKEVQP